MRRADVIQRLAEHLDEIRAHHVRSLALFGSIARDEAGRDSDVDVLVEFDRPIGYFALAGLQEYLEELLGCSVDVATPEMLKERVYESALKDLIRVA